MLRKSEAIVLKRHDFRETSLILNLFTKDFGKIGGLIKGIRNQPQRYGGLPLLFSQRLIVFYGGPKKDLNLVTQCDSQEEFSAIRSNLDKTSYAHYFVELLDAVTQEYDKNEQLFQLVVETLNSLCTDLQNWQIARIFEIKLLKLSGFKPRLDACVNCQREIIPAQGKQSPQAGKFSLRLGGVLCSNCLCCDKRAKPILKGTLACIDYIEKSSWAKAMRLKIGQKIAAELSAILRQFLDFHLEKEIKSRKLLI